MKALLTAISCPKGAIEENTRRHIELLELGAARGARIVAFPEMSLTGSVDPVNWTGHAIPLTHPALDELAAATGRLGVAALFGLAEADAGGVFITQVLADGGRVVGHYRKRTLGEDEESYRAGSDVAQFALESTPIGVAICAEGAVDAPFDDAAAAGAPVVFLCSAPGLYGRRTDTTGWQRGFDWWSGSALGDAARHARRHGLWIALATQAGATADEDFPGLAALVDPRGNVVSALPDWHEGTLLVDIPDVLVERHRRACDGFARVADGFDAQSWSASTPCTEWDARALVEHVIGFHEVLILRPHGIRANRPRENPAARWRATQTALFAFLEGEDTPPPVLPALTTDVLVHTWDLARAGRLEAQLDRELCETAYAAAPATGLSRDDGMFGPEIAVAPDAEVAVRLLARYGRDPEWQPPG